MRGLINPCVEPLAAGEASSLDSGSFATGAGQHRLQDPGLLGREGLRGGRGRSSRNLCCPEPPARRHWADGPMAPEVPDRFDFSLTSRTGLASLETILLQQITPHLPHTSTRFMSLMFLKRPSVLDKSLHTRMKLYRPAEGTASSPHGFRSVKWPNPYSSYERIPRDPGWRKATSTRACLSARRVYVHTIPLNEHLLCAGRCSRHWLNDSVRSSRRRQAKRKMSHS